VIYFNKGNYDKALSYYERSFKIQDKLKENKSTQYVTTINNIGAVYEKQK